MLFEGGMVGIAQLSLAVLFGMLLGVTVLRKVRLSFKVWTSKEHARFAREESLTRFFNYMFLLDDTPLSRTYLLKEINGNEVNRLLDKYYNRVNVLNNLHPNAQEALTFLEINRHSLAEYTNLLGLFYLSRVSYQIPELDIDLYKALHRHVFSNKRKVIKKGQGLLNRAQVGGFKRIQRDDILKNLYLEVVNFANKGPRPGFIPERVSLKTMINPAPIEIPVAQLAHIAIHHRHSMRTLIVRYEGLDKENDAIKRENRACKRELYNERKDKESLDKLNQTLQKRLAETQEALKSKEDISLTEMLKKSLEIAERSLAEAQAENQLLNKTLDTKSQEIANLMSYKEYAKLLEASSFDDDSGSDGASELSLDELVNGRRVVVVGGIAAWRENFREELKKNEVPYLMVESDYKKLPPLLTSDVVVFNIRGMAHADYRRVMSKTGTDVPVVIVRTSNVEMTLHELAGRVPSLDN